MDGWMGGSQSQRLSFNFFFLVFVSAHCLASCFVDGQSQTAIFLACFAPIAQSGRICVLSCVSCLKLVDAAGPG